MQAEAGLDALRECVDTVITIPNERLLSIIDRKTSLTQAFTMADDVLRQAIQGISDLILVPGLINLDFADVKTIMSGMGVAMMGTGQSEGENRAMQAAQKAVSSPLLEDGSVNGARGVIINVTGGPDMSLLEVNEASSVIQEAAHEDANIIFGAVVDPALEGKVKITVIATGFDRKAAGRGVAATALPTPTDLSSYTDHLGRIAAENGGSIPQAPAERPAQPMASFTSPSLTFNRRAPVELSLPLVAAGAGGANGPAAEHSLDLESPLDVPAFLRRQS
jgi:cell division protein FtsZ